VHQLRVAARRLRSELELVAALAPGLPVQRIRRRLKHWLQACSPLRDTQVQLEFLESRAAAFPESLGFRRALARKERKGARKLERQLRRVDRLALRESVRKLCQRLRRSSRPGMPRNDWEARSARALAKAAARVSLRLKAVDPADAQTLHQLRVAFKRYRYLREALPRTLSGLDDQAEQAHRDYQRRMGEIQDTQMLQDALRDYLADHPGDAGPLRRLAGFLDRRRQALIAGFMRHADEFGALVSRPG
jgi:CHAD domain-containing protein